MTAPMTQRADIYALAPDTFKPWFAMSMAIEKCGLETSLLELVKIRASQINGCANCLNMHTFDARKAGETEQRIALVAAWHEAPCYTPRERAALGWTDHITQIATLRAPDTVYDALDAQFSKEEQLKLMMMIITINGWNRLAVGFRFVHPVAAPAAAA